SSMNSTQHDLHFLSVVMPVYNSAAYLATAIESILTQTHPDFELIMADDGSTDESAQIIHAYAARDQRIRPLFLSHGGQAKAGNACVMAARGRWLARMDADDLALPERLASQLAWLQQSNVVVGGCAYVKQFGHDERLLWFPETHHAIQHELLFRVGLLQGTMMLPTVLAQAALYNEQSAFEDYEWQTRLALTQRFGNLPQILLQRRAHATQVSVRRRAAFQADLRTYRQPYFFQLFPEATARDYAALRCATDRTACSSLAELQLAGQWLVRLAHGQEKQLRQKMAERWWAVCRRSATLGSGCYQRYRHYATHFDADLPRAGRHFQLACTLRLPPDHFLLRAWRSVRQWG
ncbi:MAG: glycosyltransferase family 2 protein, partial [Caldilineaceae bacterium]|nr:glycosyltransferase family 2 protein [Caldilineaceae bacterium]